MNIRLKQIIFISNDVMALLAAFSVSCYLSRISFEWLCWSTFFLFMCITFIQLFVFLKFGLYRAVSKYAGIDVLVTVLKAATVATIVLPVGFYLGGVKFPKEVFLIDWLLTVFFIGGSRFFVRCIYELRQRYQSGQRILIYGAGDMGVVTLRQVKMNKMIRYTPVGFLDDDASKHGNIVHGVKVLGSLEDLGNVVDKSRVESVVVAIAEMSSEKLRHVVKRCKEKNIPCRIIPSFSKLFETDLNMKNIELSDLIRRSPRDLDMNEIKNYLCGKRVFITGAAGSIGSELVRQCLKFNPEKIIAFDQSEHGLYVLEEDFGNERVQFVLGDVVEEDCVREAFRKFSPSIVFHSAAYKHVPILESNLQEAVRNNIEGTKVVMEIAAECGVKSFVLISTDKAVKPSSIMGATKRICELMVQDFNRRFYTKFVAVRFGNVLGSSGSVIPKFLKQIKNGGPVTVTHPETTRYFMLIEEAVQLVLQAAAIGKGGEIFILNMGEPIRIAELAEDLIFLMGKKPYKDIMIQYIGLRPGEKIHEELFNDEVEKNTRFSDITIGRTLSLDHPLFHEKLQQLFRCMSKKENGDLLVILKNLIPEMTLGTFSAGTANNNALLYDTHEMSA